MNTYTVIAQSFTTSDRITTTINAPNHTAALDEANRQLDIAAFHDTSISFYVTSIRQA